MTRLGLSPEAVYRLMQLDAMGRWLRRRRDVLDFVLLWPHDAEGKPFGRPIMVKR